MAFRVQQRVRQFGVNSDFVRTYVLRQTEPGEYFAANPFGLYWERDGERDSPESGLPLTESYVALTGDVTESEAILFTGIDPPVCFDKLMDLM